jgi:GGDEF domain-containing protein
MTIAPNHSTLAAAPAAATPDAAVADATTLLPSRDAVLERLTALMPTADAVPTTMLAVGLLRRDDGRPVPQSTLAQVTTLLARSLRGDDWLGSSGPAEFAVLLAGPVTGAEAAGARLVNAIAALGVPGLSAAAGIAQLADDLSAGEVLRRAMLSLTAARRVGAGTVIRYRDPV